MPKIRQALAVLIAAAFCIGFNTYRYPAVWDMVAAAPQPSKPAESNAVAATPTEWNELNGASSSEPGANRHGDVVCKDGVCTMTHPDSPVANMPGSIPSYDQSEPKSATGPSYESEPKSKDAEPEYKSQGSESEYMPKGSESEYPSKTPESGYRSQGSESEYMPKGSESGYPSKTLESGYKPEDAASGSMPKDAASGYMPKGPESEYPSKTSESAYKPKQAESGYGPREAETQPNSDQLGSKPDGHDQRAEATRTGSFSYPSGPSEERKAERKPAARLVSESSAARFPLDKAEDQPVPTATLVPIERPRSRAKDAAGAPRQPVAGRRGSGSPSADFSAFRSTTDRQPDSTKTRPLPATDQASDFDPATPPPTITPELMRSYRVTPAR
jgi:hypothetical protein